MCQAALIRKKVMMMALYKAQVQNASGGWIDCDVSSASQLSPHVSFEEISNPSCQEDLKLKLPLEARIHNAAWEVVRNLYGKPIPIGCGYRSPSFNKSCGGSVDSLHLKCCAYDCELGSISDALWTQFYWWCMAAALKYDTQCELGRYKWGLHIGFSKLSYTTKTVYTYDKR